jgi:serine/threonine protein kinase/tetratricopeptide (TPR) repeat protein
MKDPLPTTLASSTGSGPDHPATLTLIPPLLADQRRRWQQGDKVLVETYLAGYPALESDEAALFQLIANEIHLRREGGEILSAEEYAQRFPKLAWQVRAILTRGPLAASTSIAETLNEVRPRPSGTMPAPPETASPSAPRTQPGESGAEGQLPQIIAGYEVQGVLGRGGMGVVYRAWQRGLNRPVALKMILSGSHAGAHEMERFLVEAESVARLQHPNIVQVYEFGQVEGRPFLALEYVNGGCLADRLDGTPQPPRVVAELLEKLARAMHHAHERGVVHRDLKPGNILVSAPEPAPGQDAGARSEKSPAPVGGVLTGLVPKITDFGLAKRLDIDMRQTHTGAILGTPSYMSPEQAAGKVREVGPGTDVYALGAIMYDLLTGRPPFKATTLADTLQQVQSLEPVPPARLEPGVPRDLETICLKCLRKELPRRYAGARDLADDLHHFMVGEPITARPTPRWERAWKWARRRPAAAALIVVSAVAAFSLLVGSLTYNAALTAARNREAAQRRLAEENFQQALDAIDGMLLEVGAVDLADVPQMEDVRRKLLLKALALFEQFPAESSNDPVLRQKTARAYGRLGEIQDMLGRGKPAEEAYRTAIGMLREIAADPVADEGVRREMARDFHNLGVLLKKYRDRLGDAEQALREALRLRDQQATAQEPEDRNVQQERAASRYHLGTVLADMSGKRSEAEQLYKLALELQEQLAARFADQPEYLRDQARTLNNLGMLFSPTRRAAEAEKAFREAIDLQRRLADDHPEVSAYRRELARTYQNLAIVEWKSGHPMAGESSFRQGQELLERLVLDFPRVPEYRYELAALQRTLGELLLERAQPEKAQGAFNAGQSLLERLAKEFPQRAEFRRELARLHLSRGDSLSKARQFAPADQAYLKALEIGDTLLADFNHAPTYQHDVACAQERLAGICVVSGTMRQTTQGLQLIMDSASPSVLQILGRLPGARLACAQAQTLFEKAIQAQLVASASEPENLQYRQFLRSLYQESADVGWQLKDHAAVARSAEALPKAMPNDYTGYVTAAEYLGWCVSFALQEPGLAPERRRDLVDGYSQRAVQLLREAVARGFKDSRHELRTLPAYQPLRQRDDFKQLLQDLEQKEGVGIG